MGKTDFSFRDVECQEDYKMSSRTDNSNEDYEHAIEVELDSSRFTHVSFGGSSDSQNVYSFENSGDTHTGTVLSYDTDSVDNVGECSGLVLH